MGVNLPVPNNNPHSQQPNLFLAHHLLVDYRRRPKRWSWIIIALLCGMTLAGLVTEWVQIPFFNSQKAHREPRQLPTTLSTTPLKQLQTDGNEKESGTIVQVERSNKIQKLPSSTPELDRHFIHTNLEQQRLQPSSPELAMQTGLVRLPPLSILKIYFPKPYREAPVVKLACETGVPSEVTIDEITVQCVVIRNAHAGNECHFRYVAEGKLKEEGTGKSQLP